MGSGGARGHSPIDLDESCQNIVALFQAEAFSARRKARSPGSRRWRRGRHRSFAFSRGRGPGCSTPQTFGGPRGHSPIDLDEIYQNIVAISSAEAFPARRKVRWPGSGRLRRPRSRSVAFHEGHAVLSKDRCAAHRGHSPIDLDEICQNIAWVHPAHFPAGAKNGAGICTGSGGPGADPSPFTREIEFSS